MKTSEVFKKKLGNLSETVKEVNIPQWLSLSPASYPRPPTPLAFLLSLIMCVWEQGLEEVTRTDIGKKIKEGMEEAAKTAKSSAETVSKSGEMLGKSGAFRAISQVVFNICVLRSTFLLNKYTKTS